MMSTGAYIASCAFKHSVIYIVSFCYTIYSKFPREYIPHTPSISRVFLLTEFSYTTAKRRTLKKLHPNKSRDVISYQFVIKFNGSLAKQNANTIIVHNLIPEEIFCWKALHIA